MTVLATPSALDFIKAFESLPGYTYDVVSNRYRNAATGQYVSFREIYSLVNLNGQATASTLYALGEALQDGSLPSPAWYIATLDQLRVLHIQQAALGAGGFEQLRPADFMRIDRMLREDMPRLRRFGEQIADGTVSPAQMQNRINMYIGNARIQYFRSQPPPLLKPGEVLVERRNLRPAEHCSWCEYLADLGWQSYGTLPVPGESNPHWDADQCFTNCQCELEQRIVGEAEAPVLLSSRKYEPTTFKGGAGSGNFGHHGRPGEVGGSGGGGANLDHDQRVWRGKQAEGSASTSKLDTGAIGEKMAASALERLLGAKFSTVNVGVNNAPFDLAGDSTAVEVKAGMSTNGMTAHH